VSDAALHTSKSPSAGVVAAPTQARNPLHGITLAVMVEALSTHYGWDELGRRIAIRCFTDEPSVGSSLKFLRKTPWARDKVESLYLLMLREKKRAAR
jgi:uncharacterized protein (DUF2132 family)